MDGRDERTSDRIDGVGLTVGWRRGQPVFSGLDLHVPGPGLTLLSGRNGSGKSTLVECLSGYLRPWQGQVTVGGHPASGPGAREVRRVLRSVPALFPPMTVYEHLAFAARRYEVPVPDLLGRAEELGLTDWLDRPAATLSTGSAQKLWYLICTVGRCRVMILDEPFLAMDQEAVAAAVREVVGWARDRLVLVITHTLPADLPVDHRLTIADGTVSAVPVTTDSQR